MDAPQQDYDYSTSVIQTCYVHVITVPIALAQISASPHQRKQSLPLFTMCFLRSGKSEHQAFLEKVMNSDKSFGPN